MNTVWLLTHVHDFGDGHEDVKLIGAFESRAEAEVVRVKLISQPGFREAPGGFSIDETHLGLACWMEGYSTIEPEAEPLEQAWACTLRHLAACRYYLPETLSGEDAINAERGLAHWLHHNELGLALAEAEALGELTKAPPTFWHELALAASSMELHEDATRFAGRHGA